jgi:hypothetical protein
MRGACRSSPKGRSDVRNAEGLLVGAIVWRWWKPPEWTWKDGVTRAFSKLRQPRCRPVVSPPSANIVVIVIGDAYAREGRHIARLTRFLSAFLSRGVFFMFVLSGLRVGMQLTVSLESLSD